jgi:hypothetical protein
VKEYKQFFHDPCRRQSHSAAICTHKLPGYAHMLAQNTLIPRKLSSYIAQQSGKFMFVVKGFVRHVKLLLFSRKIRLYCLPNTIIYTDSLTCK